MPTGAYTPEFTPVGRTGDVLQVDTGSDKTYYQIDQYRPLPDISTDVITVDAGNVETGVDLDNLAVWDGWMAQYRAPRLVDELPDDVSLQFDHGGNQEPVYQNLNQRGEIDNESLVNHDLDSLTHLFEWFMLGDEVPKMSVTNESDEAVDVQINFAGFVYNLTEVSSTDTPDDRPIYVPVESIRGQ